MKIRFQKTWDLVEHHGNHSKDYLLQFYNSAGSGSDDELWYLRPDRKIIEKWFVPVQCSLDWL